jgi:hypothetical protein
MKQKKWKVFTSRSWLLGNTSHSLRDADGFTSTSSTVWTMGSFTGLFTGWFTWWLIASTYGVLDSSRNYTHKPAKKQQTKVISLPGTEIEIIEAKNKLSIVYNLQVASQK